jgi:hypothetical protein
VELILGGGLLALALAAAALSPASAPPRERAVAATAAPRCFGAAASDPWHPCRNPALRLSVVPTPAQARSGRNAPCTVTAAIGRVRVCAFGTAARRAAATIALVGDSHASHWRAALAHVTRVRRWRGVSMTHKSCPLSTATRDDDPADQAICGQWRRQVFAWFRRHPEVHTVFVGALSGGRGVIARGGRSRFETAVEGYRQAWRRLPRSVRRIVVIRDTPKVAGTTAGCVERAVAERRPAGPACARPRSAALDDDPAALAAQRLGRPRVRTVNLVSFFCGRRTCPPVVGGALVYKDETHLTRVFATTLGPYLERALRRLGV